MSPAEFAAWSTASLVIFGAALATAMHACIVGLTLAVIHLLDKVRAR